WNLNAKLLIRWKALMQGRHFWLRSMGSSGIGLVIFSFISVFPSIFGMFPLKTVISVVIWSCFLKIIFIIFLALPSSLIVTALKNAEQIEDDQLFKYNPFNTTQIA